MNPPGFHYRERRAEYLAEVEAKRALAARARTVRDARLARLAADCGMLAPVVPRRSSAPQGRRGVA